MVKTHPPSCAVLCLGNLLIALIGKFYVYQPYIRENGQKF